MKLYKKEILNSSEITVTRKVRMTKGHSPKIQTKHKYGITLDISNNSSDNSLVLNYSFTVSRTYLMDMYYMSSFLSGKKESPRDFFESIVREIPTQSLSLQTLVPEVNSFNRKLSVERDIISSFSEEERKNKNEVNITAVLHTISNLKTEIGEKGTASQEICRGEDGKLSNDYLRVSLKTKLYPYLNLNEAFTDAIEFRKLALKVIQKKYSDIKYIGEVSGTSEQKEEWKSIRKYRDLSISIDKSPITTNGKQLW